MSTRANITEQKWERGWDGHALEQLRRLARLPLREKIAWLEQAQRVASHLAAQSGNSSSRFPTGNQPESR